MRPDPGRDIQEAMITTMSLGRRAAVMTQLRHKGMLLAWQQSDEHGPMTELERAMFLIDRLFPEMPPQHRAQFQQRFEALWEAGTWHGFQRPPPFPADRDP